jgi:hypothetical protein
MRPGAALKSRGVAGTHGSAGPGRGTCRVLAGAVGPGSTASWPRQRLAGGSLSPSGTVAAGQSAVKLAAPGELGKVDVYP